MKQATALICAILIFSSCAGVPQAAETAQERETVVSAVQEEVPPRTDQDTSEEGSLPVIQELTAEPPADLPSATRPLPAPKPMPVVPPVMTFSEISESAVTDPLSDDLVEEKTAAAEAEVVESEQEPEKVETPAGTTVERTPVTSRETLRTADVPPAETETDDYTDLGTAGAETGRPFTYTIPGEGWVYSDSVPEGMNFIKRNILGGNTEFTFRPETDGEYTLIFIFNNLLENRSERAVLTMKAGTLITEDEAESWTAAVGEPATEEYEQPDAAEIVASGFTEALREADAAQKDGEDERALEILVLCEEYYAGIRNMDRVYFSLASIYEKAGPWRDIHKALGYYRRITDNYPASVFYNRAYERISYLERNFIRIR